MARRNFPAVAAAALASCASVLERWLPGGKHSGHEYRALNPTRGDSRAGSFSVNTATGAWSDFATGDKGGDLIALVAYLDAVKQAEAHDRLAVFLGLGGAASAASVAPSKTALKASAPANDETPVLPVPADAPAAPRTHSKRGKPSAVWAYRDADGAVLFYITRYDAPGGGKEVVPLSLWRDAKSGLRWRRKGVPVPRPLYALDRLAAAPAATVIVCEGEKAADAAQGLIAPLGWIATTSPGGARAADKADWSPLRGRHVRLWPDADAPGENYATDVARLALAAGAASVQMLKLDALHGLHGGPLPDGWDAADAQAEGIAPEPLCAVLGDSENWTVIGTKTKPGSATGAATGSKAPSAKVPTGYMLVRTGNTSGRRPGVYHLPQVRDKASGEVVDAPPEWICDWLYVRAWTRDANGDQWGFLLVFEDKDGREHAWPMPATLLAHDGRELREELLRQGLSISPDAQLRKRLLEYIATFDPGKFCITVERTGWTESGAFVLPDRTIGGNEEEPTILRHLGVDSKLGTAGSLEGWREHVALPCAGNSRLVLALSLGFASACLELVSAEGGGVHLRGGSSAGKSTALALAASIFGPPAYRREWRATDNSLEALAALHSGQLLLLDEMGVLDPRHAALAAYMISNGVGKMRAGRDGSLRKAAQWLLLFLSSGEVGLSDLITEIGGTHRAGTDVRVVDLPADAGQGMGIFDVVPDGITPGTFAERLKAVAAEHYGHALHAWLDVLVADRERARSFLKTMVAALVDDMASSHANGQVRRVAARFALTAAAGELATARGITGWPQGEAERAARRCFSDWLAARGTSGPAEEAIWLAQVRGFIEQHGEARFAPMDRATDDRSPKTLMRCGWRYTNAASGSDAAEYWVLSEAWRTQICKGHDAAAVARYLAAKGALRLPNGRGYLRRERVPGTGNVNVIRLLPTLWEIDP